MNVIRFTVIVMMVSTLSSCGFVIRDRTSDYVKAEHGSPIKVPDWYESSKVEAEYPIPPIDNRRDLPDEYVLPEPPDATVIILAKNYVIESLGDQTWLLINESPGRIWPSLDHFWEDNGVNVNFENPRLGLMQTGIAGTSLLSSQLLERAEVSGSNAVFQAKLGQGVKRNTTELQIRVFKTNSSKDGFQGWSAAPVDELAENKLLEIISSYLENNQTYRSFSLLANDIGGASKVAMITDRSAKPYIKLDLSFERAWSSVTKSISASNIIVADLDRSRGVFYLDYGREEDSGNWFTDLFSSDDSDDRPEHNFILHLDNVKGSYRLTVEKASGDITRLEEMQILNLLLDNIS